MSVINYLASIAENPAKASSSIFSERKVLAGAACFFLGSLSFFLWLYITGISYPFASGSILFVLVFTLVFIKFVMLVSLLHFLLEMTGASGTAAGLFAVMGANSLVWTFLIPFGLIIRFLSPGNFLPQLIVFFLVVLTYAGISVNAIKKNYHVPGWKTWLVVAIPFVLPVLVGFLFFFGLIFWAVSSIF